MKKIIFLIICLFLIPLSSCHNNDINNPDPDTVPVGTTAVSTIAISNTEMMRPTATPTFTFTPMPTESPTPTQKQVIDIQPEYESKCEDHRYYDLSTFDFPSDQALVFSGEPYYPSMPLQTGFFEDGTIIKSDINNVQGAFYWRDSSHNSEWFFDIRGPNFDNQMELWLFSVIGGESVFIANYPVDLFPCYGDTVYVGLCRRADGIEPSDQIKAMYYHFPEMLINVESGEKIILQEFSEPEDYEHFILSFFYQDHFYFLYSANGYFIHDFTDNTTREVFTWLHNSFSTSFMLDDTPGRIFFRDGAFHIFNGVEENLLVLQIIPFESVFDDLPGETIIEYSILLPEGLAGSKNFVFWDTQNARVGFTAHSRLDLRSVYVLDYQEKKLFGYCLEMFSFWRANPTFSYIYYVSGPDDELSTDGTFIMDLSTGYNTIIDGYVLSWFTEDVK